MSSIPRGSAPRVPEPPPLPRGVAPSVEPDPPRPRVWSQPQIENDEQSIVIAPITIPTPVESVPIVEQISTEYTQDIVIEEKPIQSITETIIPQIEEPVPVVVPTRGSKRKG